MDKKEDSRVTRSKRDLRNAFMELIKTQPFEKISVTDICKTAMINKMTFYKHYQDKYDLLDDCVKSVAESIYYACVPDADIERRLNENPAELFADLLSNAFQVCYKKREILLSLVYGRTAYETSFAKIRAEIPSFDDNRVHYGRVCQRNYRMYRRYGFIHRKIQRLCPPILRRYFKKRAFNEIIPSFMTRRKNNAKGY